MVKFFFRRANKSTQKPPPCEIRNDQKVDLLKQADILQNRRSSLLKRVFMLRRKKSEPQANRSELFGALKSAMFGTQSNDTDDKWSERSQSSSSEVRTPSTWSERTPSADDVVHVLPKPLYIPQRRASDACRRGIPRIFSQVIPETNAFEGFLLFHNTKTNHIARNKSVGQNWIRVWCALGDGKMHIVQNVPSQHTMLPLSDYVVQAGWTVGAKGSCTFTIRPLRCDSDGVQPMIFKAESSEERGAWLIALKNEAFRRKQQQ